ncbi:hypothetical protein IE077_000255 [Cardiosporidium cionae]|uniref:Uncharacterized protein n=1 Tax=Cardiosporidium cionae TaxID=476202 RepID=A0ABQ7JG10_9APIC|nr:hypothetical protein IE077_000255 [Cardiosporidium cionae]|eukprot:KAF8822928.1 hypothetical protein IE077_000255 [Cardiosporidium cionae]
MEKRNEDSADFSCHDLKNTAHFENGLADTSIASAEASILKDPITNKMRYAYVVLTALNFFFCYSYFSKQILSCVVLFAHSTSHRKKQKKHIHSEPRNADASKEKNWKDHSVKKVFSDDSLPLLLRRPENNNEFKEFAQRLRARLLVVDAHILCLQQERQALLGALWNIPAEIVSQVFSAQIICSPDSQEPPSKPGNKQSFVDEGDTKNPPLLSIESTKRVKPFSSRYDDIASLWSLASSDVPSIIEAAATDNPISNNPLDGRRGPLEAVFSDDNGNQILKRGIPSIATRLEANSLPTNLLGSASTEETVKPDTKKAFETFHSASSSLEADRLLGLSMEEKVNPPVEWHQEKYCFDATGNSLQNSLSPILNSLHPLISPSTSLVENANPLETLKGHSFNSEEILPLLDVSPLSALPCRVENHSISSEWHHVDSKEDEICVHDHGKRAHSSPMDDSAAFSYSNPHMDRCTLSTVCSKPCIPIANILDSEETLDSEIFKNFSMKVDPNHQANATFVAVSSTLLPERATCDKNKRRRAEFVPIEDDTTETSIAFTNSNQSKYFQGNSCTTRDSPISGEVTAVGIPWPLIKEDFPAKYSCNSYPSLRLAEISKSDKTIATSLNKEKFWPETVPPEQLQSVCSPSFLSNPVKQAIDVGNIGLELQKDIPCIPVDVNTEIGVLKPPKRMENAVEVHQEHQLDRERLKLSLRERLKLRNSTSEISEEKVMNVSTKTTPGGWPMEALQDSSNVRQADASTPPALPNSDNLRYNNESLSVEEKIQQMSQNSQKQPPLDASTEALETMAESLSSRPFDSSNLKGVQATSAPPHEHFKASVKKQKYLFPYIDWNTLETPLLREWMTHFGLKVALSGPSRKQMIAELQRVALYLTNLAEETHLLSGPTLKKVSDPLLRRNRKKEEFFSAMRRAIMQKEDLYEKMLLNVPVCLQDVHAYLKKGEEKGVESLE